VAPSVKAALQRTGRTAVIDVARSVIQVAVTSGFTRGDSLTTSAVQQGFAGGRRRAFTIRKKRFAWRNESSLTGRSISHNGASRFTICDICAKSLIHMEEIFGLL
jgi:hypothetical protein